MRVLSPCHGRRTCQSPRANDHSGAGSSVSTPGGRPSDPDGQPVRAKRDNSGDALASQQRHSVSGRQRPAGSKLAEYAYQVGVGMQLPRSEGVVIRARRRAGLPSQEVQQLSILREIRQIQQRFHIGSIGATGLAKSLLHPAEPAFVVAIEAGGIDAVEDFDGVPGPFGDQSGRSPGVEPPGHRAVPAGPGGRRRSQLRRSYQRLLRRDLAQDRCLARLGPGARGDAPHCGCRSPATRSAPPPHGTRQPAHDLRGKAALPIPGKIRRNHVCNGVNRADQSRP